MSSYPGSHEYNAAEMAGHCDHGRPIGACKDCQQEATAPTAEPRYQVAKVEAGDGRTWAVFDMTGDEHTPAGIIDRHIFKRLADNTAAGLEKIAQGMATAEPAALAAHLACEYIDCEEPAAADAGGFCAEHLAQHEANLRTAATTSDAQRADTWLLECLEVIGERVSAALEIDRSERQAVERLHAELDAIERVTRNARLAVARIGELQEEVRA